MFSSITIGMLHEPTVGTAAFGGLTGFLVGYFIRKIVKVALFALGGVLSLCSVPTVSRINHSEYGEGSAFY